MEAEVASPEKYWYHRIIPEASGTHPDVNLASGFSEFTVALLSTLAEGTGTLKGVSSPPS